MTMMRLQNIMEQGAHPPRATLSFADYLMEGNRLFAGGNPKWLPLDPDNFATNAAATAVTVGTSSRSEEHTSELQSLMRISYAVFCLKKKKNIQKIHRQTD